jgi:hypothetical protein
VRSRDGPGVLYGRLVQAHGNQSVFSIEGFAGNPALARTLARGEAGAVDLMTRAIQEVGYLADFLPDLYVTETGQALHRECSSEKRSSNQLKRPGVILSGRIDRSDGQRG